MPLMGATEHERRRLSLQSSILNPLTDRVLRQAGVSAGMHVLDLGCGLGDVSLIAARIMGPRGSVIGLDSDGAALNTARERANDEKLPQVKFEQAAFEAYIAERPYDAVVGRHVLIHAADPFAWIQKVKSLLRSGRIAALQEYDLSYFPPIQPELPLFSELREFLVSLFRRAVRTRIREHGCITGATGWAFEFASSRRMLNQRRPGIALLRVVRRNDSKVGAETRIAGHYQRAGFGLGQSRGSVA
jgi:SAM-dependent methyltransferase